MNKKEFFEGVRKVAAGGVPEAEEFGGALTATLKAKGLKPGCHVGLEPSFFELDRIKLEWLMGQFAEVIAQENWYAIHSLLNYAEAYEAGEEC